MGKIDHILTNFLKWGSVGCLIILFLLIAAGVFVRFVPISSMGWADEVIELAFAWMVFLGASFLWRKRAHFRVEVLPETLGSSKAGVFLQIIWQLISLFFFFLFAWEGWLLTWRSVDRSPILDLPRSLWFIIIPLTGGLIIGFIIRDLLSLWRGRYFSEKEF
ncbi:MAG: TRAP transporter small permease [Thermodesulfobacteriota bacterium]